MYGWMNVCMEGFMCVCMYVCRYVVWVDGWMMDVWMVYMYVLRVLLPGRGSGRSGP